MQATDRDTLEYQPRRGLHRYIARTRLAIVIILAIAAGVAGKLCWDKFNGPIRQHLATRALQATMLSTPPSPANTVDVNSFNPMATDPGSLAVAAYLGESSIPPGVATYTFWYGRLSGANGDDRIVIIRPGNSPLDRFSMPVVFKITVAQPATLLSPRRILWFGVVAPPIRCSSAKNVRRSIAHPDELLIDFVPAAAQRSPWQSPLSTTNAMTFTLRLRADDTPVIEFPPLSSFHSSTTGSN